MVLVGRQQAHRLLMGVGLVTSLLLTPAVAVAANIAYSYQSAGNIPAGSLVSLKGQQPDTVLAANSINGKQLIGVAIGGNSHAEQVAVSGIVSVLVSNLNGDIKSGDLIGVSAFDGIGIKAVSGSTVVGVARGDFNRSTSGAAYRKVVAKTGQPINIKVGYIPVSIAISIYSAPNSNSQGLQKLAVALTGHTIPTIRLLTALVIAVAAIIVLIIMIYGSIYSSIISVGRNPLAKRAIARSTAEVIGLSALVAIVAAFTIYLLLK